MIIGTLLAKRVKIEGEALLAQIGGMQSNARSLLRLQRHSIRSFDVKNAARAVDLPRCFSLRTASHMKFVITDKTQRSSVQPIKKPRPICEAGALHNGSYGVF